MMKEEELDRLLGEVRRSAPKQSYKRAMQSFLKASGVGLSGAIVLNWKLLSTKFKIILMASTIITISSVVCLSVFTNEAQLPTHESKSVTPMTAEKKEISVDEKGIKEVTYLHAQKEIVRTGTNSTMEIDKLLEVLPAKKLVYDRSGVKESLLKIESKTSAKDTTNTSGHEYTFEIYRDMPDVEMEKIQADAIKAGVGFRYKLIVWKGKTKRITIYMRVDQPEGKFCETTLELSGKFRCRLGWVEDENGHAISLIDGH